MRQVLAIVLLIVSLVLALALGWIWIVILPIGVVVFAGFWLANVISRGRAPSSALRSVPNADLLGRGGPDDPDAEAGP
jgi:hypothetical protein